MAEARLDRTARIHELLAKNDRRSWDAALRDVVRGEMRQPKEMP